MIDPKVLRRAITLGGPKEAALFFDRVFAVDAARPLLHAFGVSSGGGGPLDLHIPCTEEGWDQDVLNSLLGESEAVRRYIALSFVGMTVSTIFGFRNSPENLRQIADDFQGMGMEKMPGGTRCISLIRGVGTGDLTPPEALTKLNPVMQEIMSDIGFERSSLWYADPNYVQKEGKSDNSFSLAVQGLELVDVSKIGWDALLEFRKDDKSMKDLRDFRLFLTETFKGDEDSEYVKDKLLSLHDQQLAASRKWGFATVTKTLSAVMDQATMITTAAASVPLAIAGGPAAVAGAVLVPVGKLALELAKVKSEADDKLAASPVRYLSRISKLA